MERFLNDNDYVSRFFMHCTDIPGDHIKNTMDMIVRSFKYRLERQVRGKCKSYLNSLEHKDKNFGLLNKVLQISIFAEYFKYERKTS